MTRRRDRRGAQPAPPRHCPAAGAASAFTPDTLSIGTRHLEVGTGWVASFAVVGYPREVHPGWLAPLLTYPARLRLRARGADRPGHRGVPAKEATGQAGIRTPSWR